MKGNSALLLASDNGHTEAVQALLAAPGINVNHANVSISRGWGMGEVYLTSFLTLILVMMTYAPNL